MPDGKGPAHDAATLAAPAVGTVTVKRSVDGGDTKLPLTAAGGLPWGVYTGNCQEEIAIETEAGATYYIDFARTSGTLTYRMAQ